MDKTLSLNRKFEAIAWGLLFILWGVIALFDFVPGGVGIAGSGLILLGLNAVRSLRDMPTKSRTTTLGILALVWGGLELTPLLFDLPFELSDRAIFAIVLIVLGGILLTRELPRIPKQSIEIPR